MREHGGLIFKHSIFKLPKTQRKRRDSITAQLIYIMASNIRSGHNTFFPTLLNTGTMRIYETFADGESKRRHNEHRLRTYITYQKHTLRRSTY